MARNAAIHLGRRSLCTRAAAPALHSDRDDQMLRYTTEGAGRAGGAMDEVPARVLCR